MSALVFMLLISLTMVQVMRVKAKKFSMPMKDNEKQEFC